MYYKLCHSIFLSTGLFAKRHSSNIDRIRQNTITRRRKLFLSGTKRSKSKSGNRFSGLDADYGLAEPLDNLITDDDSDEKKTMFLSKLARVDRSELQQRTKEQKNSQDWYSERKKRLTASNFGDICKMRSNTSCRKKVCAMLYRPNITSKEIMYGIEMESKAKHRFEELTGISVQLCGLFVDKELPYLAASPGNFVKFLQYLYKILL